MSKFYPSAKAYTVRNRKILLCRNPCAVYRTAQLYACAAHWQVQILGTCVLYHNQSVSSNSFSTVHAMEMCGSLGTEFYKVELGFVNSFIWFSLYMRESTKISTKNPQRKLFLGHACETRFCSSLIHRRQEKKGKLRKRALSHTFFRMFSKIQMQIWEYVFSCI